MRDSLGIYVHIPYCLKKCNYCDFVSYPLDKASENPDDYANRVCKEIEEKSALYEERFEVDTIFFGGGTPSCIGADLIGKILLCIKHCFLVNQDAEISIEVNPETITANQAGALLGLGFNRVSMGVQSLNDEVLAIMGRVHNANKARDSYKILRETGFKNINLDLMLGVPGQNFDIWKSSLDEIISLCPEHISFYGLQLEEGTAFYEEYKNDKLDIPSWEENRRMYYYALSALKEAGYHHYEVSNAAKPGFECKHNLKYWTMKPYIGFGTSAHSFIDGKRTDDEYPNLETDEIFTGLRLVDGYEFNNSILEKYKATISKLISERYLEKVDAKLRFTLKGLDNTNYVLGRFING